MSLCICLLMTDWRSKQQFSNTQGKPWLRFAEALVCQKSELVRKNQHVKSLSSNTSSSENTSVQLLLRSLKVRNIFRQPRLQPMAVHAGLCVSIKCDHTHIHSLKAWKHSHCSSYLCTPEKKEKKGEKNPPRRPADCEAGERWRR